MSSEPAKRRLVIVVAAYDEEANVEPLLRRLHAVLGGMVGWEWQARFVVEGRDRTREVLERVAAELGAPVSVDFRERPSGLGAAFRRGFAAVPPDADVVVTLDADLNHQPEEIPRLVAALGARDADVVVGSRFVRGSRVQGTPLWKRLLSGGVNRFMRLLYGVPVGDKTSGFRVYRASVLRSAHYRSDAFAFLPELLIKLHRGGARIVEEPIRFVFREQGRSKLEFWPTSFSYLTLLRTRFDRWSVVAAGLLIAALAVRLLVAFPVHRHPGDADVALSGMCAFRVLAGELPLFFALPRWGALECYPEALAILLLGPTRLAQNLTAIALQMGFVATGYLFLRELLGRQPAVLGLAWLALPSAPLLFWTYVPNGYPAMLLLCALLLWLAACAARRSSEWAPLGFAFVGGLGLWHACHTLTVAVPAAVWLLWQRAELRRPRRVAALLAMALAGSTPWWAFNLRHQLATFRGNFAVTSSGGPREAVENLLHFASANLPALVAATDPVDPRDPMPGQVVLAPYVVWFFFAAAAAFVLLPLVGGRRRQRLRSAATLLALQLAAVAASYALSSAGSLRGFEARYALPLALVATALFAQLVAGVASRAPALAALLAAGVLLANALAYPWPGSAERREWRAMGAADERVVAALRARGVDAVFGGYWTVYPLAYLSAQALVAVPCSPAEDVGGQEARLPAAPRWALVARSGAEETWIDELAASGALGDVRPERLEGLTVAVLTAGFAGAGDLLGSWRTACGGRQT